MHMTEAAEGPGHMGRFAASWLALREPPDHGAVNAAVRHALIRELGRHAEVFIADLGCGTGSNLRSLAPMLPCRQHWTLIDSDPQLLEAARSKLESFHAAGIASIAYRQADLSRGGFKPLIANATLVTASALFDLLSGSTIEEWACAIAANRQIFAAMLTYDGVAAWIPASAADDQIRQAFNLHQRGDKGFGPAAGPEASSLLAQGFARHGYRVIRGKSPWIVDESKAGLRSELDRSWATAVRETGLLPESGLDAWLANRARPESITIIGHEDLLALPQRSGQLGF